MSSVSVFIYTVSCLFLVVEHPAPEETVTSRFIQSIQPRHLSPTVLWFWTASALGFLGSTTDVFELALQHCQAHSMDFDDTWHPVTHPSGAVIPEY
ncbi:Cis-aconitate decarboxylase [Labeo rohita]|uniref:Cis-aconitate decarboxylase n=1 Tax=Labeo rohita TaxID=84645 RepID=A0ABQ8M313_LABRO|nr:Cis-aconitate decarboxylase [Labeo rohita]